MGVIERVWSVVRPSVVKVGSPSALRYKSEPEECCIKPWESVPYVESEGERVYLATRDVMTVRQNLKRIVDGEYNSLRYDTGSMNVDYVLRSPKTYPRCPVCRKSPKSEDCARLLQSGHHGRGWTDIIEIHASCIPRVIEELDAYAEDNTAELLGPSI